MERNPSRHHKNPLYAPDARFGVLPVGQVANRRRTFAATSPGRRA
jgi:hypothetical protein